MVELLAPEFAIWRGQEENMPLHHHQPHHPDQNPTRSNPIDHQTHFEHFPGVPDPVVEQERVQVKL